MDSRATIADTMHILWSRESVKALHLMRHTRRYIKCQRRSGRSAGTAEYSRERY